MDIQQSPFAPSPMPASPAPVQPMTPSPTPRSASWVPWGILALGVVLGIGAYTWMQLRSAEQAPQPTPTLSVSIVPTPTPSGVTRFNSRYFSLSFDAPAGYEVYEAQNTIAISKGAYEAPDIGGTNAFFQIERFTATYTKQKALANWNLDPAKNPRLTKGTITIDGNTFTTYDQRAATSPEERDPGKVFYVLFDASLLRIVEFPFLGARDFDGYTLGKQILGTMKLSSTALRETFTNSTGLFSVSVPAGFQADARYAPNMFLTQKNNTGKALVNAWDIEIGTPGTPCATDAACFQVLKASFDGAREAGSTVEYREVAATLAGRSVKGFEAWDAGAVRYTFPFSKDGKYFTAHVEITNVTVNDAAFRADSLSSVQKILETLSFLR